MNILQAMPQPFLDRLLSKARKIAKQYNHQYICIEHVLASLTMEADFTNLLIKFDISPMTLPLELEQYFVKDYIPIALNDNIELIDAVNTVLRKSFQIMAYYGRSVLVFTDILIAISEEDEDCYAAHFMNRIGLTSSVIRSTLDVSKIKNKTNTNKLALNTYCYNLSELAKANSIDPIVGRDDIINSIIMVLSRRNKGNVILTGQAGVGKTAIAEGIALKIRDKLVPEQFLNSVIYVLNISSLLAGAKMRGDVEERVKNILAELEDINNAILFIDEVHMIMGNSSTGHDSNAADISNLLKPALARGKLRIIGATTHEEYRRHIQRDKALVRRFYKLNIDPPSRDQTIEILKALIPKYQEYHNVSYSDDAIIACVDLSIKYMQDKSLPDKAIDLIDVSGARKKISDNVNKEINSVDIEETISTLLKLPISTISVDDKHLVSTLEGNMNNIIHGQDNAIKLISDAVMVSRMGLRDSTKPLATFLFVGPTGVGKTEVAKQLAKHLSIPLLRLDMSDYMEKHAVSKLIGSPPGYVGYADGISGGKLIQQMKISPYCVLLLDEIEKAHPDIYNIFLPIMDDGQLDSPSGETIYFNNAIIIMTSNIGTHELNANPIGFASTPNNAITIDDYSNSINKHFTPEFRNRIDKIVSFNNISKDTMEVIFNDNIIKLNELVKPQGIKINISETAKSWIINQTISHNMGARPMKRLIEEHVKVPLSKYLFDLTFKTEVEILIDHVNGAMSFQNISEMLCHITQ